MDSPSDILVVNLLYSYRTAVEIVSFYGDLSQGFEPLQNLRDILSTQTDPQGELKTFLTTPYHLEDPNLINGIKTVTSSLEDTAKAARNISGKAKKFYEGVCHSGNLPNLFALWTSCLEKFIEYHGSDSQEYNNTIQPLVTSGVIRISDGSNGPQVNLCSDFNDVSDFGSLPGNNREDFEAICLGIINDDFEGMEQSVLEGCIEIATKLEDILDHIEQWLSSEEAEDLKGGDKEDINFLEDTITSKYALVKQWMGAADLKYKTLGAQWSAANLEEVQTYSEEVSKQAASCLELQKRLDQLKTRQAERERFEREFPKAKEELQERLEALIRPADQGSSLMSQQYRQSQGR
jgi:hypothetical protein